jgi:hypothetical protein
MYYHSCCTDVLSTNGAVLTSITIPVVLMFCPLAEQYFLVLPFLLYCCTDVLSINGAILTSIIIPVVLMF